MGLGARSPVPVPLLPGLLGAATGGGGGGWAVALLLGAGGRKIRAGPRCQQAPALELTGCTSLGAWGIPSPGASLWGSLA